MDVKAPLTYPDYERVTGMSIHVEDVRRSIELIMGSGLPYEFRITVVPGLVGEDEVRRIGPELRGARRVALQNFRPDHCLDSALCEVMPYSPDEMDALARILRPHVQECTVRGRDRAVTVRSAAV